MLGAIIQICLIIGGPFILGKIFAIIRAIINWRSHVVFLRPTLRTERIFLSIMALLVVFHITQLINPPKSYFSLTKTPIDAPAYMIRNRFREYVSERSSIDGKFASMIKAREIASSEKSASQSQRAKEADEESVSIHSAFPDIELEYLDLEKNSMDLRNNEIRKKYVLFGQDAVSCNTCKSDISLEALLVAPSCIYHYIICLIAIGVVTTFRKKAGCRVPALIPLSIGIFMEAITLTVFADDVSYFPFHMLPLNRSNIMTRMEQMAWIRSLILATVYIFVLLIDIEIPPSEASTLSKSAIESIESSIARLQTARLARMAVMRDDTLRRHCWESYRVADRENQHLFNSPEYKQLQAELSRKYRLEQLESIAESNVKSALDHIFSSARTTSN